MKKNFKQLSVGLILILCICSIFSCSISTPASTNTSAEPITLEVITDDLSNTFATTASESTTVSINPEEIFASLSHLDFNGQDAFEIINDNIPFFTEEEITNISYEYYSDLDTLGRCGVCIASVGQDLMPTDSRESISSIYPSGWKFNGKSNNKKYPFIDAQWLYNRCHLIGFQLTGENANKKNLVTGTRFLNIDGMISFENMIADIIKELDIHVMYRVTPVFRNNNLICEGLLLEGYSVEDEGESVQFCVFSFNVQPGVIINYETGENTLDPKMTAVD